MDLDRVLSELGRRSQGLVRSRDLVAAGVPASTLSRAVASGRLVRHARGVLSQVPTPPLPARLVTEHGPDPAFVVLVRALLLAHPGAAGAGRTAAALRGWALLVEPRQRVELVVAHGRRRVTDPGCTTRQARGLRVEDVVVLPGLAPLCLVSSVDVVLDAAARLPELEAVVLVDSALRAGAVDLPQLLAAAAHLPGRSSADRARRVLALADPASGSPLESVLRVQLVTHGLTGFVTQHVLRDARGRHVLRVDFCFPQARLVVEVDGGRWHPDPLRDQRLDNALVTLGWRVLRYRWSDVVHEPERVVAEVRAALGSNGLHRSA